VRVATKVPPLNRLFPPPVGTRIEDAFPKGHIRAHTERSLLELGLDCIDLQQLHVWSPGWLGRGEWQAEVAELKREGLIRAFGVSVSDHQPDSVLELVDSGCVDTVQTIYNVFDQSPEDELLPACARNGVGVIVRVALDEGGLTGAIKPAVSFEPDDWRRQYFREDRPAQVHDRTAAIVTDLGIEQDQLAETALRYVLGAPQVSTVIVGMRSTRNVERNVGVGDGRGLPDDHLQQLHRHRWVRNFYA
jgi:aryl-alcohol dehydrogenase-like predicted oxidoreductase